MHAEAQSVRLRSVPRSKSRTVPTGNGGPKSFRQKETAVLLCGSRVHGGSDPEIPISRNIP